MSNTPPNDRFFTVLEPYYERLVRFVRMTTANREDAEDIVSDTVLQGYQHFHQLRDEQAFLSWLFSIASRLEKKRRVKAFIFTPLDALRHDREEQHYTRPDVSVDVQLLHRALQQLPTKQREAYTMFEITGLTLQEIHAIQGDSLSSVKMRISRAREKIHALLTEKLKRDEEAPQATIYRLISKEISQEDIINSASKHQ
jgi:RNA polymerase sigma-70 factor (ECF subfamily)